MDDSVQSISCINMNETGLKNALAVGNIATFIQTLETFLTLPEYRVIGKDTIPCKYRYLF